MKMMLRRRLITISRVHILVSDKPLVIFKLVKSEKQQRKQKYLMSYIIRPLYVIYDFIATTMITVQWPAASEYHGDTSYWSTVHEFEVKFIFYLRRS